MSQKTMVVTGVSSGLGLALAREALKQGWRVVGTVRNERALQEFEVRAPGQAIGRILDVTDDRHATEVIEQIEGDVAPIDVLVNNAGYGMEAPIEESTLPEIRRQFEVNVFGPITMAKAVLPYMRKRRAGRIVNVTSMGGIVTFPGIGIYNGSKFALEGVSEALGKEVIQFGIFVTAIEPGMFRTDWAGRSMARAPRSIPDYDQTFEPQRDARLKRSGQQKGDPNKAAKAILTIIGDPHPPAHLLLGPDAVAAVESKLEGLRSEIDAYRWLSLSTDFDAS